ncbi:MAG: universal stress protein [Bdellovibrionales bacterium]|nr:universal stress protein [Bdellovibrionales bacterium]
MFKSIRNIVVGVDLSTYSKTVVKQAQELSRRLKAPLTYVYTFEDIAVFDERFSVQRDVVAKYYEKEVRKTYRLNPSSKVVFRYGYPYEEIIAVARGLKQPMIVAGHKGHGLIARFFLGSTAEKLALLSPFPTWIHRGKRTLIPKKILVPCDLTANSDTTVKGVEKLKKVFSAKAEYFHVMQSPTPILDLQAYRFLYEQVKNEDDRLKKRFKKKNPRIELTNVEGNTLDKIEVRSELADVVAVTPRDHSDSFKFLGSVTSKIMRNIEKPMIVFPN